MYPSAWLRDGEFGHRRTKADGYTMHSVTSYPSYDPGLIRTCRNRLTFDASPLKAPSGGPAATDPKIRSGLETGLSSEVRRIASDPSSPDTGLPVDPGTRHSAQFGTERAPCRTFGCRLRSARERSCPFGCRLYSNPVSVSTAGGRSIAGQTLSCQAELRMGYGGPRTTRYLARNLVTAFETRWTSYAPQWLGLFRHRICPAWKAISTPEDV